MIFTLPAGQVEYFNPVNTKLQFDLKIKLPSGQAPTRLQLDPQLGGNVLIRHIRIYGNSAEMPLLEELQDVNVLGALRYDYDKNDSLCKKRAITQGCSIWDSRCRGEFGNVRRLGNSALNSPYFTPNVSASELIFDADASDTGHRSAKLILPLHMSGIFGSSVVFPNLLVSGIRVEITLCENATPFRQLPSVMKNVQIENNPRFHSINAVDVRTGHWLGGQGNKATGTDTFYIKRTNQMVDAEHFPFCVGEKISFFDTSKDDVQANRLTWTKTNTDLDPANAIPNVNAIIPVIKSITNHAGSTAGGADPRQLIKIVLKQTCYPTETIRDDGAGNEDRWAMYSVSLAESVGNCLTGGCASYEPSFEVSNAEMLVEKVEMPPAYTSKMMGAMKQGGTINYDFLSFTNYKYSQMAGDRVANIRVPIMNKRCKGTLCIPTDASVYSARDVISCGNGSERGDGLETFTYHTYNEGNGQGIGGVGGDINSMGNKKQYSERSGLVGVADGLTQYQFFYDGKLNPSRKVDTKKISSRFSISQQPLVELEKTLSVCGINPHSFSEFQRNFCIGRAVGIQQGITDLSTTDYNLQLEYQDSTNVPTKNKLWNIYIGHLRRLMIKGDSVMVDV